jgi:hypothetical protein
MDSDLQERCDAVYQEGKTFGFALKDRFGKEVRRRVPGNSQGYGVVPTAASQRLRHPQPS